MVNCAAWTDVDGAEARPEAAQAASTATGAGNVAAAAARAGAWIVQISTDYVFDGAQALAVRRVRPGFAAVDVRELEARRRARGRGALPRAAHDRAHLLAVRARGRCFPATILRLAAERDELTVVDDQVGCPTFTGHLAEALVELIARTRCRSGSCTWRPRAPARWYEFAREMVAPAGVECEVRPGDSADLGRPAPRPAYSVLGTERGATCRGCPTGARAWPSTCPRGGARGMRLLVCGGAGFIGSTFVRLRLRDHGDEVTVLDKLTYAGRRENLHDVIDDIRFVHGAIEDPAAVAEAVGGCDAIVNFAAETHVDRSITGPEAFIVTNMQGTHVLLEAAREHGLRYLQVSTDEVYGSIEEGSFTEESPLQPSSPYSATKTGADLLVSSYFHTYGLETVICRGSNNYGPRQYPEKLIPLMILNALAGDPCRSTATGATCATGCSSRTSRAGSGTRSPTERPARPTTAAGRTSARTSSRGQADPRADRRRSSR